MTDVATASVISTLSVNGITFLVLIILFEVVRGRFEDVYAPKSKWQSGFPRLTPNHGAFAWVRQIQLFSDDDILARVGMDGWVLLRFLRMLAVLSGVASFVGLAILAPVYYTDDNSFTASELGDLPDVVDEGGPFVIAAAGNATINGTTFENATINDIDLFTMANIPKESDRLWAPFICHYAFILGFLYLLHNEYKTFAQKRHEYLKTGGDHPLAGYTVMLENIPENKRTEQGLRSLLEEICPSEVMCATPVVACKPLQKLLGERVKIITNLEKATGTYEATGTRPQKGLGACGSGEKVDVLGHWNTELQRVDKLIDAMRLEATNLQKRGGQAKDVQISGTAFVTLKTRKAQLLVASVAMLYKQHPDVTAIPAPHPEDIVWANAPATVSSQRIGKALTTALLAVGLLFWGAIITFITAISQLKKLEKWLPFLDELDTTSYSLLQGLLPVVAMIVVMALIPIIITMLAMMVERKKTFSEVQTMLFGWYFGYNLSNVFFVVFAGSAFGSLNEAINEPTKLPDLLGASLPSVSTFFINYTITMLLAGLPMVQLRLGSWVMFLLCRRKKKTLTDRVLFTGPCAPATVVYGDYFPGVFYIVLLHVIYWTIAPILSCVCCLFFSLSYLIYKYQFLFVIEKGMEGGGVFFYQLFSRCFLVMQASTLTLIGLFGVKQGATQAALLFPLLVVVYVARQSIEAKFKKPSLSLQYDAVLELDKAPQSFNKKIYTQPALNTAIDPKPRSFRIAGSPLFTEDGTIDDAYYARQHNFLIRNQVHVNDSDIESDSGSVTVELEELEGALATVKAPRTVKPYSSPASAQTRDKKAGVVTFDKYMKDSGGTI